MSKGMVYSSSPGKPFEGVEVDTRKKRNLKKKKK
tara:strand:- start:3819 stop:3920 length:102 start_codon:yes stop_codon:yes gene_type:complete